MLPFNHFGYITNNFFLLNVIVLLGLNGDDSSSYRLRLCIFLVEWQICVVDTLFSDKPPLTPSQAHFSTAPGRVGTKIAHFQSHDPSCHDIDHNFIFRNELGISIICGGLACRNATQRRLPRLVLKIEYCSPEVMTDTQRHSKISSYNRSRQTLVEKKKQNGFQTRLCMWNAVVRCSEAPAFD